MKCIEHGALQAFIDGELEIELKKSIEGHLQTCVKCSETYQELKGNDDFAFEKINHFKQYYQEHVNPQSTHIAKGHGKLASEKGVAKFMLKYKKVISAACLVVVASTCISVQPIRAAISNALDIFRVENVKGINISLQDIENIRMELMKKNPKIEMSKYGKIQVLGGEEVKTNLEEAKNATDVGVLFPAALENVTPQIQSTAAMSIHFTLKVDNVNELLKTFGGSKLFPLEADGKTFSAQFSRVFHMNYTEGSKRYTIDQTASPQLNVPEGINADALYSSIIDLPLLPDNLRTRLRSIKDWKNTLYLPVVDPISKEIEINGSKGVLYTQRGSDLKETHLLLIWYNKGNVYAIQSNAGEEDILRVAESMR